MKKNLNKFGLNIIMVIMICSGCQKYLDINQNPNATNEPPLPGLLANTTSLSANNVFNISDFVSYYCQYLASPSQSSSSDTYQQLDPNTSWQGIYKTLTDLYDMRKFSSQKGWKAYEAVSDILTSANLSLASNVWGDLPYSEAFIGVENLTPIYDKQAGLYDTCLALLDRGIATMSMVTSEDPFDSQSDFIHKADPVAWVKTAYALKARLLNEISKLPQYDPAKVLDAIDHAYTSNKDDAQVTQFQVNNPWNAEAISNKNLILDAWLSSYFVNATNGVIYGVFDPRLAQITDTTMYHDYRGTPNGAGYQGAKNTDHAQCYLDVGKWYSDVNSPLQIITYSECKFIEAEAALRANNTTRAYSAYLEGIRASMTKLKVSADSLKRYIENPAVAVGPSKLTFNLIMKEKYVACFLMPVTWDDLRRYNFEYKDFKMPVNAQLSTFIRRGDYPSSATARNRLNVPEWSRTDHLWWDE